MDDRPLNLEDIALKAGVSRSTVSRVINRNNHVSAKTRAKVLAVIEDVGFSPNPAARMLVTQRTRVIGVVIPHTLNVVFEDPAYYPALLQGIAEIANKHDYGMLLWMGQSSQDEARFHQRILQNRLMDGILVASFREGDPLLRHLLQAQLPFTMVERPLEMQDKITYVSIDNVQAVKTVIEHLLGLGYQRIATITGALDNMDAQERLQGYRITLQRAGIAIDKKLIAEGRFTYQTGYLGMKKLLGYGVDAVFAASDRMALGALQAVKEANLRVPDDIAIVGFDDSVHAQQSTPQLTTVRQPIIQKGAKATELLLDLIDGMTQGPKQILLPTQLVIRESCGAKQIL
jgi:LacI family transcriptional regulator